MGELENFGRQLGDFLSGVFTPAGQEIYQRDLQAEEEISDLLDELRKAFDEKDLKTIVDQLAEDFVTFELTSADGKAITITSKREATEYLKTLFPAQGETQSKELGISGLLATSTMGYVLEEGDVVIVRPDGTKEHQPLRASAVAVRTPIGWKWTHWHMSEAAPRFRVDAQGNPINLD